MKSFAILVMVLSFGFCVLSLNNVLAQSKILINEFLIDPQPQQVEIINNGIEITDISGWIIDDSGGTTFYTIPQLSILYPNSCLVFSGDFNLNKTSADTMRLINNTELIDSFSYKSSSGSGTSYFRLPDGENNWTTGSASFGKFNSNGLSCLITPSPTGQVNLSHTITIYPAETSTPISISYDNIFINEVMVNPETGNNEWVEFYNDNDFPVSLSKWFIDDLENAGSTPKTFSLEIPAKEYRVFNISSSMFNNDGDSVRLLDYNKFLKDSFEYISSTQGKSFGRISLDNDEFCPQEPSYESTNNACINPTTSPTSIQSPTKTPTPTKIPVISSKSTTKPFNYNVLIHNNSIHQPGTFNEEEILGITTQKSDNNFLLIRLLSFISFSYSLLVSIFILIKNKVFQKYVLAS